MAVPDPHFGVHWRETEYRRAMENQIIALTFPQVAVGFVPVAIAVVVTIKWSIGLGGTLYALGRMLIQLLLIGYALAWIFGADNGTLIVLILLIMLTASAWIALRTVPGRRRHLLWASLAGIAAGGGFTLAVVTQGVLRLEPWYLPRYTIPLAGMAFANAMTAVSLAGERLCAELERGEDWDKAGALAYRAAMIPVVNALFAVGLVSLPGTMTGQILSGVSPLIAARYQIVVMCMIFASAAISTAVFLRLLHPWSAAEP